MPEYSMYMCLECQSVSIEEKRTNPYSCRKCGGYAVDMKINPEVWENQDDDWKEEKKEELLRAVNPLTHQRLYDFKTVYNMLYKLVESYVAEGDLSEQKERVAFGNTIRAIGIDEDVFKVKSLKNRGKYFVVYRISFVMEDSDWKKQVSVAKNISDNSYVIPEMSLDFCVDILYKDFLYKREIKNAKDENGVRKDVIKMYKEYNDITSAGAHPYWLIPHKIMDGFRCYLIGIGYDPSEVTDKFDSIMYKSLLGWDIDINEIRTTPLQSGSCRTCKFWTGERAAISGLSKGMCRKMGLYTSAMDSQCEKYSEADAERDFLMT